MRSLHTLRPARGAGGIHHIGQIIGRRLPRRILFRDAAPLVGQRVHAHDVHAGAGHDSGDPTLRHDKVEARVGGHEREPRRRIGRVQRHVRAARLQNGEPRHDHLGRALHADADRRVAADPALAQAPRQPVGAAVQLAVGQARRFVDNGQGVGPARRLGLEQLVHAARRVRPRRVVPLHAHPPPLRVRDHRRMRDRPVRMGHEVVEQPGVVPRHPPHGLGIIEVGAVLDRPFNLSALVGQLQGQVEFRSPGLQALDSRMHITQVEASPHPFLRREHDLKQRRMTRASLGLQRLDHLLERHVLVFLGAEEAFLDTVHHVAESGLAGQVHPHDDRVDEEPDEALPSPRAAGSRPARRC